MTRTKTEASSRDATQIDKFREAARELGCDESEERFDATVERIAKAPAPNEGPKSRKPGD